MTSTLTPASARSTSRAWRSSGCFSSLTSWRFFWWIYERRIGVRTSWLPSWRTSFRISYWTSWQIFWPRPSWPSFSGDEQFSFASPARHRHRTSIVRTRALKKGCYPLAADPSIQSPTSPSPSSEARPSSLPPNACAAPPAAGTEAHPRHR